MSLISYYVLNIGGCCSTEQDLLSFLLLKVRWISFCSFPFVMCLVSRLKKLISKLTLIGSGAARSGSVREVRHAFGKLRNLQSDRLRPVDRL